VVDHNGLDLDALAAAKVRGHLEVHHVAGVVLDDVQHPGAAVRRLRRIEHLVGRGRREHLAGAGGIEHARPDEAAVHRLVPGAAPRDEPDLPLHRGVGSNDEVRVEVDAYEVRMRCGDASQGLGDDVVWLVDQLLHSSSTTSPRVSTSAVAGSPRAMRTWLMKKSYTSAPITAPTIGATIGSHQYQLTSP